jgi:Xaa-Pro aminopeptidase
MMKLPPLPGHPNPYTYRWTDAEIATMRVMQIAAARAALEAAAKVCEQPVDEIQITDTDSHTVYMDGRDCAEELRALRIEGETT